MALDGLKRNFQLSNFDSCGLFVSRTSREVSRREQKRLRFRSKPVPQIVPQLDANQALHARYALHAR